MSDMMAVPQTLPLGLYRHFKGEYFYVTGVAKSSEDYSVRVNYFNVCKPQLGYFSRPIIEFVGSNSEYEKDDKGDYFAVGVEIKNREDNVTGQVHRFERILDLNFQLGSVSTEQLIDELRTRTDSPIHELDIEGLRSSVFATDYVVGKKFLANYENGTPQGIDTINVFFNEKEAQEYFSNQVAKARKGVFKRTFIEITK